MGAVANEPPNRVQVGGLGGGSLRPTLAAAFKPMDWSTVIPVVIANLVAVCVATLAWLQNRRALEESRRQHQASLEQARALRDLDAVRTLLDEAALKLHEISSPGFALGFSPYAADADFAVAIQELRAAKEGADALLVRLQIRFGAKHEIVDAFGEAESQMYELLWNAEAVLRGAIKPDASEGSLGAEEKTNLKKAWEGFDSQRGLFLDAAQRWAGARLSG